MKLHYSQWPCPPILSIFKSRDLPLTPGQAINMVMIVSTIQVTGHSLLGLGRSGLNRPRQVNMQTMTGFVGNHMGLG